MGKNYGDKPQARPPGLARFEPRDEQKRPVNLLRHQIDQMVVVGSAGTGKTYMTLGLAAEFFQRNKKAHGITVIRHPEPCGRSLGYDKGDYWEKMGPWVTEHLSLLKDFLGKGAVEIALGKWDEPGGIEFIPPEKARGRSFCNRFVFFDEAQNATEEQAIMFWTRLGENTKGVMGGDNSGYQSDLKGRTNALDASIWMCENGSAPAEVIRLTEQQRAPEVALWTRAYEEFLRSP